MNNLIAVGMIICQITAGVVIWLILLGKFTRSLFLTLGIGIAFGTFLSMIFGVLLHGTFLETIGWATPVVLAVVLALARWNNFLSNAKHLHTTRAEWVGALITLSVAGGLMLISWVRIPLTSVRAGGSIDMYFFEALSNGIAKFGPSESILMSGGSLRYHWFTYGWAGELSQIAGLDSFVALTRFLPVIALVGAGFISIGWAGSLTFGDRPSPIWVPSLAGLLVSVGGYTGALYGVILNTDSPSQALSTVWLLALSAIATLYLGPSSTSLHHGNHLAVAGSIGVLTFAVVGGKASSGFVVLGALGFATAIGLLLQLPWAKRALFITLIATIAAGICYLWVLSGIAIDENLTESLAIKASTWQNLDPVIGRWAPLLGTAALVLAVSTRVAGIGWFLTKKSMLTQPAVLFSLGAMLTGISALVILSEGINELWFVLAASAPAAVISAYGAGQASWSFKRPVFMALVVAVPASALSLLLSQNWKFDTAFTQDSFFAWPGILYWLSIVSVWIVVPLLGFFALKSSKPQVGRRQMMVGIFGLSLLALTFTAILTRPAVLWTQSRTLTTEIGLVTPQSQGTDDQNSANSSTVESMLINDQLAASDWLATNTEIADVIATSVPTSAQIPALTGRRMFIAGSAYQRGLGAASEAQVVQSRTDASELLNSPAWNSVARNMCDAGVQWFWIENADASSISRISSFSSGVVSLYSKDALCGLN